MSSFKDPFNELVQLTELFLLQEYNTNHKVVASFENYSYFKQQAAAKNKKQQNKGGPAHPVPSVSASPLPKPDLPPESYGAIFIISSQESAVRKDADVKDRDEGIASAISEERSLTDALCSRPIPDEIVKVAPYGLKPELLPPPSPRDFSELRKIVQEKIPEIKVIDTPAPPKKSAPPAVLVLYLPSSHSPAHRDLLHQIVKAISLQLSPARLVEIPSIESPKGWEEFFLASPMLLLLISQTDLNALPHLQSYLKSRQKNIPILLMPSAEDMLRDPAQKRTLWNSLKSFFNKV